MKKLIIGLLTGFLSMSGWSACTYDLDVTQATLNSEEPGSLIFPNRSGQKVGFNIFSTSILKYFLATNNNVTLNSSGITVPSSSIYAYEYKFKVPKNQLLSTEQLLFFPVAHIGKNGDQSTFLSNVGYTNASTENSAVNKFTISDPNANTSLVELNISNNSNDYQYIGIYINPISKQAGFIVNGVNKGYLSNYTLPVINSFFMIAAGLNGISPNSPNIGKEVSIELITDATKMTQSYPTGTTDICGNTI
ncbi:DUF4882 family protein [Acinetobacter guillouiae]|uniref:DUF4882 family protein n=1 Tax=Acinetobacter guillouiae TaxID=106649 RepID=UPI003AF6E1BD